MTIKEIIMQTNINEVLERFEYYYGNEHSNKVKRVYVALRKTIPKKNKTNMKVFIRVLKENEQGDNDIVIERFDVNDTNLFFDVCGEDDKYDGIYSIASSKYDELLGYYVSQKTIRRFTYSQIVAHLLWEVEWK